MLKLEELPLAFLLKKELWWYSSLSLVCLGKSSSLISEGKLCWVKYSWLEAFSLIFLKIRSYSLLICQVSAEKSADGFIKVPLHVMTFQNFSLAAFRILIFNFWEVNYNVSWWKLLSVNFVWGYLILMYLNGHVSPQIWGAAGISGVLPSPPSNTAFSVIIPTLTT